MSSRYLWCTSKAQNMRAEGAHSSGPATHCCVRYMRFRVIIYNAAESNREIRARTSTLFLVITPCCFWVRVVCCSAVQSTSFPSLTLPECAGGFIAAGFNPRKFELYDTWFDENSTVTNKAPVDKSKKRLMPFPSKHAARVGSTKQRL